MGHCERSEAISGEERGVRLPRRSFLTPPFLRSAARIGVLRERNDKSPRNFCIDTYVTNKSKAPLLLHLS